MSIWPFKRVDHTEAERLAREMAIARGEQRRAVKHLLTVAGIPSHPVDQAVAGVIEGFGK